MLKIPLGRDKLHRNIDHDLYSKMSINRSCLVSLLIKKAKKERKARELATLRVKTDRVCFAARVNNYSQNCSSPYVVNESFFLPFILCQFLQHPIPFPFYSFTSCILNADFYVYLWKLFCFCGGLFYSIHF